MLYYLIILFILIIQFNINNINNNCTFINIINNIQNPYLKKIKLLCNTFNITNIIEYSLKISSTNINNNRETIICIFYYKNDIINFINKLDLSKKFRHFIYNSLKNEDNNYKYYELIIGNDNKINKIYIYISTQHIIYGLEHNNNKYFNRFYKEIITNKIPIKLLKQLITNKLYIKNIIKCLKILPNIKQIFKKFNNQNVFEAIHIAYNKLLIGKYIFQIKKLINIIENKNMNNINKWINKNIDKYIYLIGFTYKNNNINITFYYR